MPQDTPRLPFEIDDAIDPTLVTGRAGVPLVIELFKYGNTGRSIICIISGRLGPAGAVWQARGVRARESGRGVCGGKHGPLGSAPRAFRVPPERGGIEKRYDR